MTWVKSIRIVKSVSYWKNITEYIEGSVANWL